MRRQKQHSFEVQLPGGFIGHEQMAVVRWIERSAEQAQADQLTEVPPWTSRLISVPFRSE